MTPGTAAEQIWHKRKAGKCYAYYREQLAVIIVFHVFLKQVQQHHSNNKKIIRRAAQRQLLTKADKCAHTHIHMPNRKKC